MPILIDNQQNRQMLDLEAIAETARQVLAALQRAEAELSILIVDDLQIEQLNRSYLNHVGPTNVISFPMQEGPFADISPNLLGDVVISADTAAREARDAGMTFMHRFNQLLVHGILHLCGFDHEQDDAQAHEMEQKSQQLMQMLDGTRQEA
jgi:probable rRNA maturation factor